MTDSESSTGSDDVVRADSVSDVDGPEHDLGTDVASPTSHAAQPSHGATGPDTVTEPDGASSDAAPGSPYPDAERHAASAADDWRGAASNQWPGGLALASARARETYAPVQFDPASEFEPPRDLPPWYEDEYFDDQDWERLPRGTSTVFRVGVFAVTFLIVALIAGSFVKGWVDEQLDPPGEPGEEVVIEVPQGASTNDIVRILADADVVANSTVFRYYLRYKDAGEFQAGEYTFRTNMAVWDAREVLDNGPRIAETINITVVEGLTLAEMKESLLSQLPEFDSAELQAAIDGARRPTLFEEIRRIKSAEGLLFPATYDVPEEAVADEAALVERMVAAFDQVAADTDLAAARRKVGITPYQAVIVASLIEEEARLPEDRPKIARVIYNRLEAGWLLGIDATVVYALGGDRELSQSDLEVDSPYNTRRYPGLPPGPIAAPSRSSIEAALNPAEGDWMYYVLTDASGAHTFAETEAEFEAARQICIERDLGCG